MQKGQDILLEVAPATALGATIPVEADWETVGYMRSKSVTESVATIDASSDNNPDWTHAVPGQSSFNFGGDALYVYDDAGQTAIFTAKAAQDTDNFPWFRFTSNDTGDTEKIGQVIITEITEEGSTNEMVTFSLSTEGVGELTRRTIT